MKIHVLTAITTLALPFMALGQTTEPQQTTTQGQTNETQTTAPAKAKKMRPAQEQSKTQATKPETGTNMHARPNVKGHAEDVNAQAGARSTTGQTNVSGTNQTTTVNKQEFMSRHSEVFSLGRHPQEFFVQRFGANHVRLIGNTYYAFVDGCWVSVDVDGFVYTQRVICLGEPDFIVIE
jgi:cytoskeletal protein RodZ